MITIHNAEIHSRFNLFSGRLDYLLGLSKKEYDDLCARGLNAPAKYRELRDVTKFWIRVIPYSSENNDEKYLYTKMKNYLCNDNVDIDINIHALNLDDRIVTRCAVDVDTGIRINKED